MLEGVLGGYRVTYNGASLQMSGTAAPIRPLRWPPGRSLPYPPSLPSPSPSLLLLSPSAFTCLSHGTKEGGEGGFM